MSFFAWIDSFVSFPLVCRLAIFERTMSLPSERMSTPLKSVGKKLRSWKSKRFSIVASNGRRDYGIANKRSSVHTRTANGFVVLKRREGSKMEC